MASIRRPILIASLPTTHGRVSARAVWRRTTYVLRLTGRTAALCALLPDGQVPTAATRQITRHPAEPVVSLTAFESFYEAEAQHWHVLRTGSFSEFVPGLPARPAQPTPRPCPTNPPTPPPS